MTVDCLTDDGMTDRGPARLAQRSRRAAAPWKFGLLGLLAVMLAACTASPPTDTPQVSLAAPPKAAEAAEADMPPAVLREHHRILGAYGGSYTDPKLQATIERMVERLVAASERPDLH